MESATTPSHGLTTPLYSILDGGLALSTAELAGLALLALISYAFYWTLTFRPAGFPPGPPATPFLGTFNGKHPSREAACAAYAGQYGPVMSMSVNGVKPVVVVNDYEVYKADVKGSAASFADRPFNAFQAASGFDKGIVQSNGAHWLATRKFALMALRENGMGTKGLVKSIVAEADHLTRRMGEHLDKPWVLRELYQSHIANMVSTVIFGNRFADDDPELHNLLTVLESQEFNVETVWMRLMMTHSCLTSWLPKSLLDKVPVMQQVKRISSLVAKKIEENKASLDVSNPGSVVDYWLAEQETGKPNPYLADTQVLTASILDLFFAGIETTSMSLTWMSMFLAEQPEMQERVHAEIVDKLGENGAPEYGDISAMPVLNAFLHETMRMSSLVPLGVEHCTVEPVTVGGFRLAAGTTVTLNQIGIHRDPRYWKHPHEFNPENFLDAEGAFRCPPYFLAFGFGNRVCIGQNLAKTELFVFMTRVLQRFRISAPAGAKLDLSAWGDFLRRPRDQALVLTAR
eukprot:jgi/Tetstr1/426194/TSEL_016519.t1